MGVPGTAWVWVVGHRGHAARGGVGRKGACDYRSPGLRCIPVRIRRVGRPVRVRSDDRPIRVRSNDCPIRCHIDPTERSSDAFQLIRREAGNRKANRRTAAAMGRVQITHPVSARRWGSTGVPDGPAVVLIHLLDAGDQRQDDRMNVARGGTPIVTFHILNVLCGKRNIGRRKKINECKAAQIG